MNVKQVKNAAVGKAEDFGNAVVRGGSKITLPEGLTYKKAIETLQRQEKYENEVVQIFEKISGQYWDGAHAFYLAMQEQFGWVYGETVPGFFGDTKPQMHSVDIGVGKTVLIPMGRFTVPGINGYLQTHHDMDKRGGRVSFAIVAEVLRKHEKEIRTLVALARNYSKEKSIYRGKAVRLRFVDDDGDRVQLPVPKFIDVRAYNKDSLILPEPVANAVETSVFTMIEHTPWCRQHTIPLKRSVMFEGMFGTGKTLAAHIAAKLCEDNNWTFFYCERSSDLADMVREAHAYEPAMIFCEDVDRVTDGERDIDMDTLLNIVDGIESKNRELMIIFTSNDVESINKAMIRQGRMDDIIKFLPPDAATVEKLIRHYGRGLVPETEDIHEVGVKLAGNIPAAVRECVERAKLSAIKFGARESLVITKKALLDAAVGMQRHLELLNEKQGGPDADAALGKVVRVALGNKLRTGDLIGSKAVNE